MITTLRIFYAYLRDALCTGPVSFAEAKALVELDPVLADLDAEIARRKAKHQKWRHLEPRPSARVHQILAGQA